MASHCSVVCNFRWMPPSFLHCFAIARPVLLPATWVEQSWRSHSDGNNALTVLVGEVGCWWSAETTCDSCQSPCSIRAKYYETPSPCTERAERRPINVCACSGCAGAGGGEEEGGGRMSGVSNIQAPNPGTECPFAVCQALIVSAQSLSVGTVLTLNFWAPVSGSRIQRRQLHKRQMSRNVVASHDCRGRSR